MKVLDTINEQLRKGYWMLGVGFFIVIAFALVERKKHTNTTELVIGIMPLDKGHFLIKERDIRRVIQNSFVEDIAGMDIKKVDLARMETVLEEDAFIKNAEVWINAKNQVHISVEQREPILRVIDNNGLNYYLDVAGHKIPTSKYSTARVPVATGEIPAYFVEYREKENALLDVFELARFIAVNDFLKAQIAQITVLKNGDLMLTPEFGNTKIIFGKTDRMKEKFSKLLIFYNEALPHEGWRKFKTINLKFTNQVVAERR